MQVTDEEAAALRAMLAGEFDEHQRLLSRVGSRGGRIGYSALVSAAFAVAADDRFPAGTPAAEIVEFLGGLRAGDESASRLDPRVAERVILAVTSDEETGDIEPQAVFETQLVLLTALAADAQLQGRALDAFLGKARKLADSWLP